jgi:hypothetical protein
MHFRSFIILLVLIPCSALVSPVCIYGQTKEAEARKKDVSELEVTKDNDSKILGNARSMGPVVKEWAPKTGSINSIIELQGYRLYPGALNKTKSFFIQNGIEIPARTGGGTSVTNDDHNGPQSLEVIVPEEVVTGPGQIVVEVDGHRSMPATVTITEWKPPIIKRVIPTRGGPGTFVSIECDGFHVNDEIEITDAEGKPVRFDSGGSSRGTGFVVRKNTREGILTIRIGNSKYGNGQYTEPFTFLVTNDPLPLELITAFMKSVAPGQWLGLQASNGDVLKHSERTEVAFKQAGRSIIVAAPKPFRPHVAVPGTLSAGEVELQVRTWRDGRPSEWSQPTVFKLADKPLAPSVGAIRLSEGTWVQLWPGPDRATSFAVTPGDEVVLNGLWPVADASKLKVSLVRPGEVVTLTATELDEKADWFSDVRVRLPQSLEAGEWRMIVSSESDGTQDEVPIVIRVSKQKPHARTP